MPTGKSLPFAVVFLLFVLELSSLSFGQSAPFVRAPHQAFGPRIDTPIFDHEQTMSRSMVGGPWMLDPNMKSTLYMRNVNEKVGVVATPVLYLSNGRKIVLSAINIAPAAVATVSIGDALAKQGIAPYADLRGYAEINYDSSYDPLCATVISLDTVHSVIFTYGFRPTAPVPMTQAALGITTSASDSHLTDQRIEGVWWKQTSAVKGFVTLSNVTNKDIGVQLTTTGSNGVALASHPLSVPPHATDTVDLSELGSSSSSAGGIKVTYNATAESILINGGLEDIATGYSAAMAFRSLRAYKPANEVTTLTELGLMTGAPDPMMLFPAGTAFTPFSVLHNVSEEPVSLTPELFWMQAAIAHRQALTPITVQPGESTSLNTPSLLKEAGLADFSGTVNLTFTTASSSSALVLASGSVDKTGTYVFQVLPHQVGESLAKSLSYWSTGSGSDTMVSVWNPADEEQDFLFTVRFAGGSYTLPIHLEPRGSRFFNISSLIKDQMPDPSGHVIPLNITEGSAILSGVHAENERILVDFDAGTYNVLKATCSYHCVYCTGFVSASIGTSNFPYGTNFQLPFMVQQDTGNVYNESGSVTSWSGTNSCVAEVKSTGLAFGLTKGSFSISGTATNLPVVQYQYCGETAQCPVYSNVSATGTGNVVDNTPVIQAITPSRWVPGTTTAVTITGYNFGTNTPTLGFDPGTGISYTLSSFSDGTINANVNVVSGTPSETVNVTVTNNGYGGIGFYPGSGQPAPSATSNPYSVYVAAPTNAPEVTTVAWINGGAADLLNLANIRAVYPPTNPNLINALTNHCFATLTDWTSGVRTDITTQADIDYANAWLILTTANPAPSQTYPPNNTISPFAFDFVGSYRLYNDYGGSSWGTHVGSTPSPCGNVVSQLGSFLLGGGMPGPADGVTGVSPSGRKYQVAQGRAGTIGQDGYATISGGRSLPWIYSVVEFDSAGNYLVTDHSVFPTFAVYVNGTFQSVAWQSSVKAFLSAYDASDVNDWSKYLQ